MINIIITILIFSLITLIIQLIYAPALDVSREGKITLWYGVKERKFVVLRK